MDLSFGRFTININLSLYMFIEWGFCLLFLDGIFMSSLISQRKKKEFEFIITVNKVFYEPVVYYSVCIQRKECAYKLLKTWRTFTPKDMHGKIMAYANHLYNNEYCPWHDGPHLWHHNLLLILTIPVISSGFSLYAQIRKENKTPLCLFWGIALSLR